MFWARLYSDMFMPAGGETARVVVQIFLIVVCFSGVSGGGVGGGGVVNVHWTCTLTWCYATARSLQFTQLRDATLLHVLLNLHNYVMLRYCTFSWIYTTTWCYATARSLESTQLRARSKSFPVAMAKQWQKWLDVCHRPRLEQKTAKLMNDKKRRALNTFSPVKTNATLKCTLKIPRSFEQLSDHKIATGPQRQPHRIAKNEQPLARFSPRRDVYAFFMPCSSGLEGGVLAIDLASDLL